jgi:hypothetical protein
VDTFEPEPTPDRRPERASTDGVEVATSVEIADLVLPDGAVVTFLGSADPDDCP